MATFTKELEDGQIWTDSFSNEISVFSPNIKRDINMLAKAGRYVNGSMVYMIIYMWVWR
jgi:hypothetical protein